MIEFLLPWLPLIILVVCAFFVLRSSRKRAEDHINDVMRSNQEIVETNREMIGVLKEIRDSLKK